jgi:prepilin-type N-terminal cleavage/methylation domain-containing protein
LNKRKEGFTIVEVLIVLAIAGVIMLVVFLAVPALQRNSRNNQRRSDVSHLAGLINEYAANHAGTLPTGAGTGAGQVDLTKEKWAIMTAPSAAFPAVGTMTVGTTTTMNVLRGVSCDTTTNTLSNTGVSPRTFAISYQVETGGAASNACVGG